jgi:hypothetical protein
MNHTMFAFSRDNQDRCLNTLEPRWQAKVRVLPRSGQPGQRPYSGRSVLRQTFVGLAATVRTGPMALPRQNIPRPVLTTWNIIPGHSWLRLVYPSAWEKTPPNIVTIHMMPTSTNRIPRMLHTIFIVYLLVSPTWL